MNLSLTDIATYLVMITVAGISYCLGFYHGYKLRHNTKRDKS